jgi:hypothetical protein
MNACSNLVSFENQVRRSEFSSDSHSWRRVGHFSTSARREEIVPTETFTQIQILGGVRAEFSLPNLQSPSFFLPRQETLVVHSSKYGVVDYKQVLYTCFVLYVYIYMFSCKFAAEHVQDR